MNEANKIIFNKDFKVINYDNEINSTFNTSLFDGCDLRDFIKIFYGSESVVDDIIENKRESWFLPSFKLNDRYYSINIKKYNSLHLLAQFQDIHLASLKQKIAKQNLIKNNFFHWSHRGKPSIDDFKSELGIEGMLFSYVNLLYYSYVLNYGLLKEVSDSSPFNCELENVLYNIHTQFCDLMENFNENRDNNFELITREKFSRNVQELCSSHLKANIFHIGNELQISYSSLAFNLLRQVVDYLSVLNVSEVKVTISKYFFRFNINMNDDFDKRSKESLEGLINRYLNENNKINSSLIDYSFDSKLFNLNIIF